jgi:chromosome segregation ATPase
LERQLQESRNASPSREADERTLRLQTNVNELRGKLEDAFQNFSLKRQDLENEIEELSLAKTQLQAENNRLKSLSSSSVGKLEEENHELTLLIERKNKEIKQLEDAASKGRVKLQVLEKSIEELRNTKDSREDTRNDSGRITAVLKQELAETEGRYRQAKTELEEAQDEMDGLRRELRRAREEMASLRLDEGKSRSLDSISKAGLEKYEARLE